MFDAVEDDSIVAGYRTDADDPDIEMGWDLEFEAEVEAPAYDAVLDLRYAEPLG